MGILMSEFFFLLKSKSSVWMWIIVSLILTHGIENPAQWELLDIRIPCQENTHDLLGWKPSQDDMFLSPGMVPLQCCPRTAGQNWWHLHRPPALRLVFTFSSCVISVLSLPLSISSLLCRNDNFYLSWANRLFWCYSSEILSWSVCLWHVFMMNILDLHLGSL